MKLCVVLWPVVECDTAGGYALQVLTTLGFLAMWSFQQKLPDQLRLSQSSWSQAMPTVLDGIVPHSHKFSCTLTQANTKVQCAVSASFPDCNYQLNTQCLKALSRKHFQLVNVPIICDAQTQLTRLNQHTSHSF